MVNPSRPIRESSTIRDVDGGEPDENKSKGSKKTARDFSQAVILVERKGIEPSTSRMPFYGVSNTSRTGKGLTETASDACTTACTNNHETAKATNLDALAAELLALPKEERARLLAKLLGNGEGEGKAG
jgi:hypothetical protein